MNNKDFNSVDSIDNIDNIKEIRYVNEYKKIGNIFNIKKIGNGSIIDKLILQTFISLVIVVLLLLITGFNTKITESISSGIKTTVAWNVDISKTMSTFSNFRNIIPNAKKTLNINDIDNGEGFVTPVDGTITSNFGMRVHPVFNTEMMHNGIDIAASLGTSIKAAASGKVEEIGEDATNGKYIKIINGRYEMVYDHCNKILANKNAVVKQGDIIAEVGDTGIASGPHLHFEILENGKPIDPVTKLNMSPKQ